MKANLLRGISILVVGILVIGVFYLSDLFVMWILPFFVAQATAMTAMTDLHLNYSWPVMLAGILCLFAGFVHTVRGLLMQAAFLMHQTDQLERTNRDLHVEITERMQAEETLRKSEQRYRAVVDAQTEIISRSLPDTTLTFVNEAYCKYFGKEADEVIGESFLPFVVPEAREAARAHFASLVEEPRRVVYEHEVLLPDGSTAWNEWIDTPILDEEGRVVEFQSVGRDITERKRAQEALREYTDRLKVLREIDRAILAAQAPEAIAEVGLRHVHELVPCSYANVVIFDEEAQEAQLIAIQPDIVEPERRSLEDVSGLIDLEGMRQGQVHRVADIKDLPQVTPLMKLINAVGIRALLSVPLMAQGQLIGTLNVGFDQPDAYTDQHVEIAREVADSLAVAIEHARLLRQVREANIRLQSLFRQLVQAQEAERRTLARELHDQIGQTLTAVKLSLQAVRDGFDDASNLDEHIHTVSHALDQVRTLSLDLRPSMLDDLGLAPALRWYVERQARQAGFEAQVVADEWEQRLPPELEVTCFRVVQEALTNIARHAGHSACA